VDEDNGLPALDPPALDLIDQSRHRLRGVDRVEEEAFEPSEPVKRGKAFGCDLAVILPDVVAEVLYV
jgi:hypothetical protein